MNLEVDTTSDSFSPLPVNISPAFSSGFHFKDGGATVGIVSTSNQPPSEPESPLGIPQSPQSSGHQPVSSPSTSSGPMSPPPRTPETPTQVNVPGNNKMTTNQDKNGSSISLTDTHAVRQVFVPCKVCGDKASGYHYGVTSCEGCKGFFRRSIQKQIEYRCLRDGKCLVMRLNRNRCQYCRFKKCLAVGMSRDSVRYGRVPKRSKSLEEQTVSTSLQLQDQQALENKHLAMYDIILTVSQAHHANCTVTEEKMKIASKRSVTLITKLELENKTTEETLEAHRCNMFQSLSNYITPVIQQVVEFAKRVPAFTDLSQDDQLILIKSSFFEIWLSWMARLLNSGDGTLTFDNGGFIPKGELEIVYSPDLVAAMFNFAQSFAELKLNDTEIGIFSAVTLTTPDRAGVTDHSAIEKIHDQLMDAMKLQISRNHVSEPHLQNILLHKLSELHGLAMQHNILLQWFRIRWKALTMPPLFAEIYDIQKSDAEAV